MPRVRAEVRRRYQAEVAFTDHAIGRFYDRLEARGLLDDAWFVVTADHGEEFWEHGGFLHGHTLFDELLRVPLIMVPPRGDSSIERGLVVRRQVRLEDIAPTLVEIAAARGPETYGKSLLPLLRGEAGFLDSYPVVAGYIREAGDLRYAVRHRGKKLVVHPGAAPLRAALYNLGRDPGEKRNVVLDPEQGGRSLALVPRLLGIKADRREAEARLGTSADKTRGDLARELRSLGYLD